jgi:YidC/Oxa1 family membrane protein insertase
MEKRAVLAFVLIILVWVAFYYLVFPQYTSPPGSPSAPEPSSTDRVPSPSLEPSPLPPSPEASVPGQTDKNPFENWDRTEQLSFFENDSPRTLTRREIVVESDYFRGVFDTRGAVIRSWQLKKYRGIDGPWVEIIPSDREYGPDVILTTEQGPISFRNVLFEADSPGLTLDASHPTGSIAFRGHTLSGVSLIKRFTFTNQEYAVKIEVALDSGDRLPLGSKYYMRWGGGLRITEQAWESDVAAFRGFASLGDAVVEQNIGAEPEPPKPEDSGEARWVGIRSKYFLMAIVPESRPGKGVRLNGRPVSTGGIQDRQIAAELAMGMASNIQDRFLLYLGPVHYDTLAEYHIGLENTVDLGWSFIRDISKFILDMLVWLHHFISNYGLVIIVLSVIVKIVLYPLTYKSMKATQGMQQLQPKIEALREKYKNDMQKLNQEMMKLYREAGINPLGGCLPLLLQMPILYALYAIFSSTIELRDAPFIGWIQDLSLKDPFYVLPILMGVTMFIQSKMTMKDPRQMAFVYLMPIMLFFFMKDLPAGLILYWTMVNVLSIIQQFFQNRFFPTPS